MQPGQTAGLPGSRSFRCPLVTLIPLHVPFDVARESHGTKLDQTSPSCTKISEMTSDEIYRRNPARDVEKLAVEVVKRWVGALGTVRDTSSGGGPDFDIDYIDGRRAVGEVGWHEDPRVREMWGNTFKQERHQTVELEEGTGTWALHLVLGANIKQLHRDLPGFVAELSQAGCFQLEIYDGWPRSNMADTARRLGIEYITRHDEAGSSAIYFMPGSGGTVPTDPNVIADWIEAVLRDPAYADTTDKLLPLEADERHVFLMSGSATPFGADERLRRVSSEAIPTRPLVVPPGITHVWAVSQFGGADVLLWTCSGWTSMSVPHDPSG